MSASERKPCAEELRLTCQRTIGRRTWSGDTGIESTSAFVNSTLCAHSVSATDWDTSTTNTMSTLPHDAVGLADGVAVDGRKLGTAVGRVDGALLGADVGPADGSELGVAVGVAVGSYVGASVGEAVGISVGTADGSELGAAVGAAVGCGVGESVGEAVGA